MEITNTSVLSFGSAIHAAKRAADLLFVLQNKEQLDYQRVVVRINETLKAYGEQDPDVTFSDLDDLKIVARKLQAVFAAEDTPQAAAAINDVFDQYARVPRLSVHGGTPWHLHVDADDHASWAEWLAASSALALAILLAEKQRNPGGFCSASGCERPYIDLGKGGVRNYCSPRCATRARVAAYRKR